MTFFLLGVVIAVLAGAIVIGALRLLFSVLGFILSWLFDR